MLNRFLSFFMEQGQSRDTLIERRHLSNEQQECWSKLTLAQKFSASSLSRYGYQLNFIRVSQAGSLAIMLLNDKIATVAEDGDINTSPDIHIRH